MPIFENKVEQDLSYNYGGLYSTLGMGIPSLDINYPITHNSDGSTNFLARNMTSTFSVRITPPKVVDVNVIVPNKVVEVTFADGTKEKSVCREPDVFSLETAISICISKKIMGGSGAYNNAIKHSVKVYEDKLKKEAKEKAEKERIEKKRAKRLAYLERKAAKKKEAEKEEQIEIQKEAYIRAMEYMNSK